MKSKILWWVLGGLGVLFILSSLFITYAEYQNFTQNPVIFPAGSLIAGIPVGGLDRDAAETHLSEFYNLPLVMEVDSAILQAEPASLGFSMDANALIDLAVQRMDTGGFWKYLWGLGESSPVDIPLSANIDEDQLRTYLRSEIAPRYTQPGTGAAPIPFTTNFRMGSAGQELDIESAVTDIKAALISPEIHRVAIKIMEDPETDVTLPELEVFLAHNINWIGFDGLVEVYLESLATGEVLHFAVLDGLNVDPDVAFTAASTIKIPIMISVLSRLSEPTPDYALFLLEEMIALSGNTSADILMQTYLDEIRGPLVVSEDMAVLGLQNTFLGGYLSPGEPLLQLFETPANTRTDINLDPDIYSQTVTSEIGALLSAMYICAEEGGGLLTETFPDEISQAECQLMTDILSANQIGVLIEAGVPSEATVAHKHGWTTALDGLLHTMSDVAIVYSPGGDYVLNIFIHDATRLDFEEGNRLLARLSQTVYNFFNIENQAYWWFD